MVLKELLAFIKLHHGIHTYIGLEKNSDSLHEACLALERISQIERLIDDEHHVFCIVSKGNDEGESVMQPD